MADAVRDRRPRAGDPLAWDVPDLDPAFRRARVTSKGGAIEYVSWVTATARLLPRLLAGRATGPVFLADRRAPTRGHCAPAADDIDPTTGSRPTVLPPRGIPVQTGHHRP